MNENDRYESLGRIAQAVICESLIGRLEALIARNDFLGAAQLACDAGLRDLGKGILEMGLNSERERGTLKHTYLENIKPAGGIQ